MRYQLNKAKKPPSGNEKETLMTREPTRILWASRHQPTKAQIEGLHKLFGQDMKWEQYRARVENGQDLLDFYNAMHYDELVLVGPDRIFAFLIANGVYPIKSVGSGYDGDDASFNFHYYERIVGAEVSIASLKAPLGLTGKLLWVSDREISQAHRTKIAALLGKFVIIMEDPSRDMKKILDRVTKEKFAVVIAKLPMKHLARLRSTLPESTSLVVESAINTKGMADFITVRGAKMKLLGFSIVNKAVWKRHKLAC